MSANSPIPKLSLLFKLKTGIAIPAPAGTGACITLDSTDVGSYTVRASNGSGCWSELSSPIVVTYNANCSNTPVTGTGSSCPSGWWSQPSTNNCDSTLRFLVSSKTPGSVYTWNFGDGTIGTGDSVIHKYPTHGAFMVKLVVTNGTCKDSTAFNTYVNNCSNVTSGGSSTSSCPSGWWSQPSPTGSPSMSSR